VDHAVAPSNFGADIMRGWGDVPGHRVYHADLTRSYGVRHVWRGRVTSVLGQETRPRLASLCRVRRPLTSLRTAAKEIAKHAAGRLGSAKYAMHGPNRVQRRATLRDGGEVYEFMRCNPHPAGVSVGDTGREIAAVITDEFVEQLVRREGVSVLYTHLGKVRDPRRPLDGAAVRALRRLALARDCGLVGVLSTRRLLGYLAMRDALNWSARGDGRALEIDVRLADSGQWSARAAPAQLAAGLTFYVPGEAACTMRVNGEPMTGLQHNPPDHTGRPSVSVPLPPLQFPENRDRCTFGN
jgi:hypothetical protein